MDNYKRNRLIGLGVIGVIVLIGAVYFLLMMTSGNNRIVEPIEAEASFSAELSGPFDYTTFNLPVGYSKYRPALDYISLFASFDPDYVLSRLPKKIENIVFSTDGLRAIVFESNKVSFYDVASNSLNEMPVLVGGWGSGAFVDDFYTIGYDEPTKKDALKVVSLASGDVEDLVYFIRNIEDYEMIISNDPTVIFMVDKTHQPNVLYKIDIQEASRENILEADFIKLSDITDDASFVAFVQGDNQFQSTLKIYDTQKKEFSEIPYKVMPRNFKFHDEYAYFVSDSEEGDNIITAEELLSSYIEPKTITLYKWDPYTQTSQQFDLNELPAMPDRIEVQDDVVRMLIGDEYWDAEII